MSMLLSESSLSGAPITDQRLTDGLDLAHGITDAATVCRTASAEQRDNPRRPADEEVVSVNDRASEARKVATGTPTISEACLIVYISRPNLGQG